jgi:hypothetical protein
MAYILVTMMNIYPENYQQKDACTTTSTSKYLLVWRSPRGALAYVLDLFTIKKQMAILREVLQFRKVAPPPEYHG